MANSRLVVRGGECVYLFTAGVLPDSAFGFYERDLDLDLDLSVLGPCHAGDSCQPGYGILKYCAVRRIAGYWTDSPDPTEAVNHVEGLKKELQMARMNKRVDEWPQSGESLVESPIDESGPNLRITISGKISI